MSVRNQLRLLMGGLGSRHPSKHGPGSFKDFLDRSGLVATFIFIVTVSAIVTISFVGTRSIDLPIFANQISPVRVVASVPFTYVSSEKSQAEKEQLLSRVPRIYRLDLDSETRFEMATRDLLAKLASFELTHRSQSVDFGERHAALAAIADDFDSRGPYEVSAGDLSSLLSVGDAATRSALFENGFAALREIYAQGVHDSLISGGPPGSVTVFEVERITGGVAARPVQSMEDALTFLRVSLAGENLPHSAAQSLFLFFRNSVKPNLIFDAQATRLREDEALRSLRQVAVKVARGQAIVEAGSKVTQEQYDMLVAHRRHLSEEGTQDIDEGLELFGRVLLVLAMILASLIYIRLEDPETFRSNVRLGLLALVVIVNLALVRGVYSVGGSDFFIQDARWSSVLPYLVPTALAPLIVAILIDAGSAIFMALFISIFTGVIFGNRIDLLVLTLLASMVAIYGCRDARRRSRVVRAATMGGLTVAAFAGLIGIAQQTSAESLALQMGSGVVTGVLTGIAVAGLLPVLESLFKRTTDITLLELTDYNHPLLRRMQLEAPGTYHHSLVVAQLSENACNAIGANPLLARACALFHDIGKSVNPSFFSENQRNRSNPHDEKDPAASARIIKQHVAHGVELASRHRLPRAVVDVIRQHHGTTLVRYFYERAVASHTPFPGVPPVPEAPYRYDGPKPQFKESAVVSLADGVEAAARSLRTVSAEQLSPLIEKVVAERIADHQLDEAPVTLEDLAKIKNSFIFTLLNMLHARVAYPGSADAAAQAKA